MSPGKKNGEKERKILHHWWEWAPWTTIPDRIHILVTRAEGNFQRMCTFSDNILLCVCKYIYIYMIHHDNTKVKPEKSSSKPSISYFWHLLTSISLIFDSGYFMFQPIRSYFWYIGSWHPVKLCFVTSHGCTNSFIKNISPWNWRLVYVGRNLDHVGIHVVTTPLV